MAVDELRAAHARRLDVAPFALRDVGQLEVSVFVQPRDRLGGLRRQHRRRNRREGRRQPTFDRGAVALQGAPGGRAGAAIPRRQVLPREERGDGLLVVAARRVGQDGADGARVDGRGGVRVAGDVDEPGGETRESGGHENSGSC